MKSTRLRLRLLVFCLKFNFFSIQTPRERVILSSSFCFTHENTHMFVCFWFLLLFCPLTFLFSCMCFLVSRSLVYFFFFFRFVFYIFSFFYFFKIGFNLIFFVFYFFFLSFCFKEKLIFTHVLFLKLSKLF